ncbi:MAG: aromatic amino acid hydroxylase [Calditrichaceae bacterium]
MAISHEQLLLSIPEHLRQFVVEQNYDRYTSRDQAVWRYIMRRNLSFLKKHAHPAYFDGLKKTGISADRIPDIGEMNDALSKIGWRAVVVDGFIPPAAFMEFQMHKILVISAEIRTIQHILYTPAPDIVHEAAGHAPIIADEQYSRFLQKVGEYGSKAFSSKLDYEIYEAIRYLSIIKEYPDASEEDLVRAEKELSKKIAANTAPSEATLLSRLHWWTVEYGLIGTADDFKIYGAGLLSSVGESKNCLNPIVKKLPLAINTVNYNYDITKEQPQLFIAHNWTHLNQVLEEFADSMCFRTASVECINTAIDSKNVATVELSSGIQVSGKFNKVITNSENQAVYIETIGKTAFSFKNVEIENQGIDHHPDGAGFPVGKLINTGIPLEDFADSELQKLAQDDQRIRLPYESGMVVTGKLKQTIRKNGKIILLRFTDFHISSPGEESLSPHQSAHYDMAVGERIVSVFSGSADKTRFNVMPPKSEKKAIPIEYSDEELQLFEWYQIVRQMRESNKFDYGVLKSIFYKIAENYTLEWLLPLEIYELLQLNRIKKDVFVLGIYSHLNELKKFSTEYEMIISAGMDLLE